MSKIKYFSHDINSKDDIKCLLLIEQMGTEGYGIFWILIETLAEQQDNKYPLSLLGALARKYNTTQAKLETVVKCYGLFTLENDDTFFYSKSLSARLGIAQKSIEQKRDAGRKSAEARRLKKEQRLNGVETELQQLNKTKLNKTKLNKKNKEKNDYAWIFKKIQSNSKNIEDYIFQSTGKIHPTYEEFIKNPIKDINCIKLEDPNINKEITMFYKIGGTIEKEIQLLLNSKEITWKL